MIDPTPSDPDEEPKPNEPRPEGADSSRELDKLRELLVGPEREDLRDLRDRLDRIEVVPEDVSRTLPQAILLRTRQDDQLSKALTPTIESAIETSVKRNPGVLVDAIFPVMGPAIRKSIRETLASMVESINRSVEHSLTPQGIRWRLEARRTGKPFAEIILKHSLVFRVSEVFLIHRETALLLQHVLAPGVSSNDPDMISSMLGAIQDFVSDSFTDEAGGGIAQIEFGEQVLLIARSPSAVLACVVRGVSTIDLKQKQQRVLERICAELGKELREFSGDDSPFLIARTYMEELLIEQKVENAAGGGKAQNVLVRSWVVALLIIGIFVILLNWVTSERSARATWQGVLDSLNETPGIVVTRAERDGDSYSLAGLRDPLAINPIDVAYAAGLDSDDVTENFEPYLSLEPELIVARARQRLAAPEQVEFTLEGELLILSGRASTEWIQTLPSMVDRIPGVNRVDWRRVIDVDQSTLEQLAARIAESVLSFATDDDTVRTQSTGFETLRGLIAEFDTLTGATGAVTVVEVCGHTATEEVNRLNLRVRRAQAAIDALSTLAPNLQFVIAEDPDLELRQVNFRARVSEE